MRAVPLVLGSPLSDRELEVLRLAAEGMSNEAIAEALKPPITRITVKNHLYHVFIKLGANDRAHAVAIGIREGYLEVGPPQHLPPERLTPDEIALVREILSVWRQYPENENGLSRPW